MNEVIAFSGTLELSCSSLRANGNSSTTNAHCPILRIKNNNNVGDDEVLGLILKDDCLDSIMPMNNVKILGNLIPCTLNMNNTGLKFIEVHKLINLDDDILHNSQTDENQSQNNDDELNNTNMNFNDHHDDNNSITGLLIRISRIQIFSKDSTAVFLAIKTSHHNENEESIVVLQNQATNWRPYLSINKTYRITNIKKTKLKGDDDCEIKAYSCNTCDIKCLDTNKSLLPLSLSVTINFDDMMDMASLIQESDIFKPESLSSLGIHSISPLNIQFKIMRFNRRGWLEMDLNCNDITNEAPLMVYILGWRDHWILPSLCKNTIIKCTNVLPIYIWGKLRGFTLNVQSSVHIINFASNQIQRNTCTSISSVNHCTLLVAWIAMIRYQLERKILGKSTLNSITTTEIMRSIIKYLSNSNFIPSELWNQVHSARWMEFIDLKQVALRCVRADVDHDYFCEQLPYIMGPTEVQKRIKLQSSQQLESLKLYSLSELLLGDMKSNIPIGTGLPQNIILIGYLQKEYNNDNNNKPYRWCFTMIDNSSNNKNLAVPLEIWLCGNEMKINDNLNGSVVMIRNPNVLIISKSLSVAAKESIILTTPTNIKFITATTDQQEHQHHQQQHQSSSSALSRKRSEIEEDPSRIISFPSDVISIRSILRKSPNQIQSDIIATVLYTAVEEETYNNITKSKAAIYLRDIKYADFIVMYVPIDIASYSDIKRAHAGSILCIKKCNLNQGGKGRYYLTTITGMTSIELIGCVDMNVLEGIIIRAMKRPDMYDAASLGMVNSLSYQNNQIKMSSSNNNIGALQPAPRTSLQDLLYNTNKSKNLWTIFGSCTHLSWLQVTLRCNDCGCPLLRENGTSNISLALSLPQWICKNDNCIHANNNSSRVIPKVSWEAQSKFSDGSAEAIMYLHDSDVFEVMRPNRWYAWIHGTNPEKRERNEYAMYDPTHGRRKNKKPILEDQALKRLWSYLEKVTKRRGKVFINLSGKSKKKDNNNDNKNDIDDEIEGRIYEKDIPLNQIEWPDEDAIIFLDDNTLEEKCINLTRTVLRAVLKHRLIQFEAIIRIIKPCGDASIEHFDRTILVQKDPGERNWYYETQPMNTRAVNHLKLRCLKLTPYKQQDLYSRSKEILTELKKKLNKKKSKEKI